MGWLRYWPVVAVLAGLYGGSSAWAAILLYHAGIVWAIIRRPEVLPRLRQGACLSWMLMGGLGALVVSALSIRWGLPLVLGHDAGRQLAEALSRFGVSGLGGFGFAAYFVTVHPVLEECAWRGLIPGKNWLGDRSDLEFAAYHLVVLQRMFPGEWVMLLLALGCLVILAGFWRELARRSGGLALPVCVHAGADAGLLLGAFGLAYSASPA